MPAPKMNHYQSFHRRELSYNGLWRRGEVRIKRTSALICRGGSVRESSGLHVPAPRMVLGKGLRLRGQGAGEQNSPPPLPRRLSSRKISHSKMKQLLSLEGLFCLLGLQTLNIKFTHFNTVAATDVVCEITYRGTKLI